MGVTKVSEALIDKTFGDGACMDCATQTQAESGTGTNLMTAERTKQAIAAQAASTAREYTKAQNFDETTLAAGVISWDLESNQCVKVTLNQNCVFGTPNNMSAGATYILTLAQDATGGRTVTWDTEFRWEGGVAPDIATGANETTVLCFYCDGTYLYGQVFWKEA